MRVAVDDEVKQAIQAAKRVCFFAHYHDDAVIADHVLLYLTAIKEAGFAIALVSTSPLPAAEIAKLDGLCAAVILRENEGLDFGSWIKAIECFFPIGAELLLLANDSVYAPVGSLADYVERLCSAEADFYGAVESEEFAAHLQSWFLLLRPAAYNSSAFKEMMRFPMMPTATKLELIKTYEIDLTRRLTEDKLTYHAGFSSRDLSGFAARHPFNYAHILWRALVRRGMPFIKIELVRQNPFRVTDIRRWRKVVGEIQPALVPAIERDIARRGQRRLLRWMDMTNHQPHYWPEVRFLLHRTKPRSRSLARFDASAEMLLFRLITASTRPFRRLNRKLRKLRAERCS